MKDVKLLDKIVGDEHPCYVVAEIGGAFTNFEEAKRLIDSGLEIGVDAIKFQTLEAETITTKDNYFGFEATGNVRQYDVFKHFELSKDLQKQVVDYARNRKIPIFSAPSHIKDLEIMKEMDLDIYKIGSDLACHVPLLKKIATFDKPIILSTGMCDLEEVRESVNAIKDQGNEKIILMHCVSNYPSSIDELNLNAIETMKKEFDIPVGFSDHTIGINSTVAAANMGANIIERHFRDIRNTPGPDDIHSLLKEDFERMIKNIRDIEKARGTGIKKPTDSEKKNLDTNRVSIIAMKEIPKGVEILEDMIDIRRPGTGILPINFEKIIGMKTCCTIKAEEPLTWDMIETD
ncbi:MAG: N-acylneuraminate-9-phosphate synthase [Candidatus Nitrosopelagicus sp.]|nr:MAG: N-acylneuraminate-9-phosphate synthase [Candidatus Nitrosopelagicus sp.]